MWCGYRRFSDPPVQDFPPFPIPPNPPFAFQLGKVSEDALPGHGQQPRLQTAVDAGRDLVGGRLAVPQRLEDLLLAFEAMRDVAPKEFVRALDDRTVSGEQSLRIKCPDPFQ